MSMGSLRFWEVLGVLGGGKYGVRGAGGLVKSLMEDTGAHRRFLGCSVGRWGLIRVSGVIGVLGKGSVGLWHVGGFRGGSLGC